MHREDSTNDYISVDTSLASSLLCTSLTKVTDNACLFPCKSVVVVTLTFKLVETPITFTVPLKDTEALEKESVVLECEVSKPDVKPKWFKDGKEIKPDKKKGITTKTDGRKHSLTIPSAMVDDGGKYAVEVGDKTIECKLTVEGLFLLLKSISPFSSMCS